VQGPDRPSRRGSATSGAGRARLRSAGGAAAGRSSGRGTGCGAQDLLRHIRSP
jgi:hypothetical protein